ncbi:MAG: cobalt-precorrin-6A reductase [Alphaproteobacteria bacterium]|nr:cobalt-precorrin-6A reductase [Alphaproteobacteria bacterium]
MPDRKPHLLILGGTAEAAALARRCADAYGAALDVTTSLAGATEAPPHPPGRLRIGGFGGVEGLRRYLAGEAVDAVIDATHPFARRMQANAASACALAGVPRCRLLRPPWPRRPDDRWIEVDDLDAAAAALAGLGPRVFLALGLRDLAAFAALADRWFLVRAVSAPDAPPPLADWRVIQARGPFRLADERRLLVENRIDAVVSRQSGGEGARAKIDAARELGLPVVMIRRPAPPVPPLVASVDAALEWLGGVLSQGLAPARRAGAV